MDSLKSLVQALLSQILNDAPSPIITMKSETGDPASVKGQKSTFNEPAYDPTFVYMLELSTVLTLRDKETAEQLGAEVSGALQNVIRDSTNHHPTVVGRTVFYLMNVLRASYVSTIVRSWLTEANGLYRITPS